jgi:hypothetical protein
LLREKVVLQLHSQIFQRRFGGLQGETGVERLLLDLGIRELQDHGIGTYYGAGPKRDSLDAPIRRGRQPARIFRDERAEAAHLTDERTALDGVEQESGAIDRRSGGFHARQRHGQHRHDDQSDDSVGNLAEPLAAKDGRVAGNIHRSTVPAGRSKPMPAP